MRCWHCAEQVCHGLDSQRATHGMYLLDSGRWDVHKGGPADKVRTV